MVSAVLWSSLGAARAVEEDKRAGAAFLVACSFFSSSGARDLWWVRVALSLALVVSSGGRFGLAPRANDSCSSTRNSTRSSSVMVVLGSRSFARGGGGQQVASFCCSSWGLWLVALVQITNLSLGALGVCVCYLGVLQ